MTGVASQHNIRNCRVLVRYKNYLDVCSNDTAAHAPHLSMHPQGIRGEERHRKRVRGNDRVPSREEPHKLHGSTKSRKELVRPRAGKDRLDHRLRQHQSHLRSRRTEDCGCVWTTELSIKPW